MGGVAGGGAEVVARQEAAKVLRVSAATYRVVKAVCSPLAVPRLHVRVAQDPRPT